LTPANPSSRAGPVFLDKDNDGVLDSGETSKLTDASGNYKFTLLAAGSYHVREVTKSGMAPQRSDAVQ